MGVNRPTVEMIKSVVDGLKSTYALRAVNIFGSNADGRAAPQGDLDLPVEFDKPTVSLIQLNALKYNLEDALGLPVDVIHTSLPAGSMIQLQKVARVL